MASPQRLDVRELLCPGTHRGMVALVTGGGTGIGRATALDLARLGADVVVAGRRREPLDMVAAEIEAVGSRALAIVADIREDDQVNAMVARALEQFVRIDILVNNAGGQFRSAAEGITSKGWRAVHRLAVEATWAVTREVAVRSMIPNRRGVIFFMAFSPRRGIPGVVHATSARAAVENLAAGLSLEWSRYGIRSICIAPGAIGTEALSTTYTAEQHQQWTRAVPLGRLGSPEEVSGLIAFLASPGGRYVTGTTIVVDGGADAWGVGHLPPPVEQAVFQEPPSVRDGAIPIARPNP